MSSRTYVNIGSINVVMHPHHKGSYIDLIEHAYAKRTTATYWGNRSGVIGSTRRIDVGDRNAITGEILFFTDVDFDSPWLDLEDLDEAGREDMNEIIIPDHLKPEMKRCRYIMIDQGHTLYYFAKTENGDTFGPTAMGSFISKIFNDPELKKKFGDIDTTINPSKEAVSRMLNIPHISKLDITITRPNPDDFDLEEKAVLEDIEENNAKRKEVNYSSKSKSSSITPSDKTKILAKIASKNGFVRVKGKDADGKPVDEMTKKHPDVRSVFYSDNGVGPLTAVMTYIRENFF